MSITVIPSTAADIIPANDQQRLQALHRYQILYTAAEESFDNITRLMADVFDMPMAFISLVDGDTVFYKSQVGPFGRDSVQRTDSLCSLTILSDNLLIIEDASGEACFKGNPYVDAEGGIRFYAGAPLITDDGHCIGTACLVDTRSRTFSEKEKGMLVRFARLVMHEIEVRYANLQQAETAEQVALQSQELNALNRELQFVTDTMPQLVWATEPDGYSFFFNKGWLHYTGLCFDEVKGSGWMQSLHPDDFKKTKEAWQRAVESNASYDVEYRLRRWDGVFRWFVARGVPMRDSEGNILKWYGTSTDITEQREAASVLEQRVKERTQELENQRNLLDNILQNSSNGISVSEMIKDENGRVVDAITILANDAAVNFVGMPRDLYLSQTANELEPGILDSEYGKSCLQTLATGEPTFTQYHMQSSGAWLELTVSKMDDNHLIHIFTDVTPIKEAQLRLEQLVEDLRRTNNNLEDFAYAASHDMKEPIRKIHFFSDRLHHELQGKLNENQSRLFERLQNASRRMGTLIEDLLAYSQATKGIAEQEEINLNEHVKLVLEDLDLEVQQKNAHVRVEELPTLRGNKRQLQQLFQNLLTNALKYSREEIAPEIHIAATLVKGSEVSYYLPSGEDKKPYYYLLQVKDNGIGFHQQDAERIFNVFTRLHTNAEYRGTGVGLSIVQKVVQNHGGFIWAQATPGEGAVFSILFPVTNPS